VAWTGVEPAECKGPVKRSQIVLVQQDSEFLPGTVRENLVFPFTLHTHRDKQYSESDTERMLTRLQIDRSLLDRDVSKLSGGQKQRVSIVRALLLEPRALLADEPSASLDQVAEEAMAGMLKEYSERHLVIVVSHSTEFLRHADTVVLLSNGRIARLADTLNQQEFRDFLGEDLVR